MQAKNMSKIWEDTRFANLLKDARFKNLPVYKKQTKIDKRFKSMFEDKTFKNKKGVDKYGRPLKETSTDNLKKYYELESDEEDNSDKEAEKQAILEEKAITNEEDILSHAGDDLSSDGIVLADEVKKKLLTEIDFARGEGRIVSESSSDGETSEDDYEEEIEHEFWGEIDNNIDEIEDATSRLAICNLDWEQVRAADLMVLCSSFLPVGGAIINVKIFVSEFGKKCLAEEDVKGPLHILKDNDQEKNFKLEISENEDSADEGDAYHMEKLRQYQINKLKYYYAVVECDSKETAEKLYQECDGLEYESTGTKMDLRFIPEDMAFETTDLKEECSELPSNLTNYKPYVQPVTALQQAKVKVTWDETTIERKEVFEKLSSGKIDDIDVTDLKKFINCSDESENSSDETSDTETQNKNSDINGTSDSISKYKSLLESINEKEKQKSEKKYEMEYTWGIDPTLNNKLNKDNKKNSDDGGYSSDEDLPSDIDLDDPYFAEELKNCKPKKLKKKNQKNEVEQEDKTKINELKLLLNDCSDETDIKISKKSKKKLKRKNKDDLHLQSKRKTNDKDFNDGDNFQVDVTDKRFESIYTDTSFSIDPNNPRFKKSIAMDSIIQEKIKRRNKNNK